MVGDHGGRLAMLNPQYRVLPDTADETPDPKASGHH
jgi:hypothetical protein